MKELLVLAILSFIMTQHLFSVQARDIVLPCTNVPDGSTTHLDLASLGDVSPSDNVIFRDCRWSEADVVVLMSRRVTLVVEHTMLSGGSFVLMGTGEPPLLGPFRLKVVNTTAVRCTHCFLVNASSTRLSDFYLDVVDSTMEATESVASLVSSSVLRSSIMILNSNLSAVNQAAEGFRPHCACVFADNITLSQLDIHVVSSTIRSSTRGLFACSAGVLSLRTATFAKNGFIVATNTTIRASHSSISALATFNGNENVVVAVAMGFYCSQDLQMDGIELSVVTSEVVTAAAASNAVAAVSVGLVSLGSATARNITITASTSSIGSEANTTGSYSYAVSLGCFSQNVWLSHALVALSDVNVSAIATSPFSFSAAVGGGAASHDFNVEVHNGTFLAARSRCRASASSVKGAYVGAACLAFAALFRSVHLVDVIITTTGSSLLANATGGGNLIAAACAGLASPVSRSSVTGLSIYSSSSQIASNASTPGTYVSAVSAGTATYGTDDVRDVALVATDCSVESHAKATKGVVGAASLGIVSAFSTFQNITVLALRVTIVADAVAGTAYSAASSCGIALMSGSIVIFDSVFYAVQSTVTSRAVGVTDDVAAASMGIACAKSAIDATRMIIFASFTSANASSFGSAEVVAAAAACASRDQITVENMTVYLRDSAIGALTRATATCTAAGSVAFASCSSGVSAANVTLFMNRSSAAARADDNYDNAAAASCGFSSQSDLCHNVVLVVLDSTLSTTAQAGVNAAAASSAGLATYDALTTSNITAFCIEQQHLSLKRLPTAVLPWPVGWGSRPARVGRKEL